MTEDNQVAESGPEVYLIGACSAQFLSEGLAGYQVNVTACGTPVPHGDFILPSGAHRAERLQRGNPCFAPLQGERDHAGTGTV